MIVRYDEPLTDDVNIIEDQDGNQVYWRGETPPSDNWKLIERNLNRKLRQGRSYRFG